VAIDPRNDDIIGIGVLHIEDNRARTIVVGMSGVERYLRTQKRAEQ
jgi:hypothetical protein